MSARATRAHTPSCNRLQTVISVGYERKIASELAHLSVQQQTIAGDAEEAAEAANALLALRRPEPQQSADAESASTAQRNAFIQKTQTEIARFVDNKRDFKEWAEKLAKAAPVAALESVVGVRQTTRVVAAAAGTPGAGTQQASVVAEVSPPVMYGRFCSQNIVLELTNRKYMDEETATAAGAEFDRLPPGNAKEAARRTMQDAELKIMNLCATITPLNRHREYRERTVEVPCEGPRKYMNVKLEVLRHLNDDLVPSRVNLNGTELECIIAFKGYYGEIQIVCQTTHPIVIDGNVATAVIRIPDARRDPPTIQYDWADYLGDNAHFLFRPKNPSHLLSYPRLSHHSVDFRLVAALDEALRLFPNRPNALIGGTAMGFQNNYMYNDLSQPPVMKVNAGIKHNALFHFNAIVGRPPWTRAELDDAENGVWVNMKMDIPLECVLVGQWKGIDGLQAILAGNRIPTEKEWVPADMEDALQPLYRSETVHFHVRTGTNKATQAFFSMPSHVEWPSSAGLLSDQPFYFRIQPATDVHRKLFPYLTRNTRSFFMKSESWTKGLGIPGSHRVYKDGRYEVRRGNKGESSSDGTAEVQGRPVQD